MASSLFLKLNQVSKYSENQSFKSIAKFIINNDMVLGKNTIFDLAKKTNTSGATITRFCKHIGYDGYKDFVVNLKIQKNTLSSTSKDDLNINFSELINSFQKNIENSFLISSEDFKNKEEKIIKLINKTNKIFLYSKGGNKYLANLFHDWMTRIGYRVFFSQDGDQQMSYLNLIQEDDVIFVISYSLESFFFDELFNKTKKFKKIIITKNENSPLISENDTVLKIGNNESTILKRQNGEVTTLFILKLIFNSFLEHKHKEEMLIESDINFKNS